jgi:hypothetical protein
MRKRTGQVRIAAVACAAVVLALPGVFGQVVAAVDVLLFRAAAAQAGNISETSSSTESTTRTRVDLANVDQEETRIVATSDGAVVFDQTVAGAVGSPAGVAAVDEARATLASACAVAGPDVSGEETGSTTNQVGEEPNGSTDTVTVEETIGPATVFIGPNKSEPFVLLPGELNININIHTEFFVDQLFQTTVTRRTTYTLTGTACGAPPPAPVVSGTERVVPATPVPAQPRTAG